MDPLSYLSVRFHYRGTFVWGGKEWLWKGGRHGMSTVPLHSKLSVKQLKAHLADHVAISEQAMEKTVLCYKMPAGPGPLKTDLLLLEDIRSVSSMVKSATDVGVIDIYAKIPAEFWPDDNAVADEQQPLENASLEYDYQREEVASFQEAHAEQIRKEKEANAYQSDEQIWAGAEEQPCTKQIWASPEQKTAYVQKGNAQQVHAQKLPVVRTRIEEKGKGVKVHSDRQETESDTSDSDYNDDAHEGDDSNSSVEDEEAINYRQQAKELRKKIKNKMLGEEEFRPCKVPDEYVAPENVKLEEDAGEEQCYDTEDELSYDDDSDDEDNVKTRRTKHRVYDETAEVQEFELRQAFTDIRQFKNALINYGLKNFHHLLFPKDEKNRVSAKCSWSNCKWSIYGSISGRSTWLIVTRYNNVHTCVPGRHGRRMWL
ncbi:unnamed protein product [Alopecurus aequalis]